MPEIPTFAINTDDTPEGYDDLVVTKDGWNFLRYDETNVVACQPLASTFSTNVGPNNPDVSGFAMSPDPAYIGTVGTHLFSTATLTVPSAPFPVAYVIRVDGYPDPYFSTGTIAPSPADGVVTLEVSNITYSFTRVGDDLVMTMTWPGRRYYFGATLYSDNWNELTYRLGGGAPVTPTVTESTPTTGTIPDVRTSGTVLEDLNYQLFTRTITATFPMTDATIEYRLTDPYGQYTIWRLVSIRPDLVVDYTEFDETITLDLSGTIRVGDSVEYTVEFVGPGGPVTIGPQSSPEFDIDASVLAADSVTLTITAITSNGCADSVVEVVTLTPRKISAIVTPEGKIIVAVPVDNNIEIAHYLQPTTAAREVLTIIENARNPSLWRDPDGVINLSYHPPVGGVVQVRSLNGGRDFV